LETSFGDAQSFFSSAQDTNDETSVYETSRKLAFALRNHSVPTVFVCGGNLQKKTNFLLKQYFLLHFHIELVNPKRNEPHQ
jgi:hypothetical protein